MTQDPKPPNEKFWAERYFKTETWKHPAEPVTQPASDATPAPITIDQVNKAFEQVDRSLGPTLLPVVKVHNTKPSGLEWIDCTTFNDLNVRRYVHQKTGEMWIYDPDGRL